MKKTLVILLSLVMAVCVLSTVAFAEEGNFVTDQAWSKNLCTGEVTKKTEDGVDYWSATGITAPYSTPGIDIMPALIAALGGGDEAEIYLSFEVRATGVDGEFKMGTLVRGNPKKTINDTAEFSDGYSGEMMKYSNASNINYRLNQNELGNTEWTQYEYEFTVTAEDLNTEFWKSWMLCLDRIDESVIPSIKTLDFRNVQVRTDGGAGATTTIKDTPSQKTTENTEAKATATPKPTATEAPAKSSTTPTPLPINEPFNFDKYGVTFTATEKHPMENAGSASLAGGNTMLYIIIAVAVVVVVGGGTTLCLIVKNKKKKASNETAQEEETK